MPAAKFHNAMSLEKESTFENPRTCYINVGYLISIADEKKDQVHQ